jgi:serine/threonine-protein kinase
MAVGKYRLQRKLGSGGFAEVWRALDTVEGIPVALKFPFSDHVPHAAEAFRTEIRLVAGMEHPNILTIKNAEILDGRFVVAFALGEETLGERMQRRMTTRLAIDFAAQLLAALDYAHSWRIIHCDVKPDNLILFPENRLRLTDFGISKVAAHTLIASGSGTVGYCAPEQAMGRPSFRSDVFSAALVIWRMLSGELPEWPFRWPLAGHQRLHRRAHPELVDLLRRALAVDHRKRYADCRAMNAAFMRLLPRARRHVPGHSARRDNGAGSPNGGHRVDWNTLRFKQFRADFRGTLKLDGRCGHCHGPIAESFFACPWCGQDDRLELGGGGFPDSCPRCNRGRKKDWRFCAWCYGPGFDEVASREYKDIRYSARCANRTCGRRDLMPHMRYCPWCRTKVRKPWPFGDLAEHCPHCHCGVAADYWSYCPWCTRAL